MTILKWLLVLVAVLYVGGVAVVFFMQRSMLFPIPPVGRTAPAAAGLPEAEEQVLTTGDGEKVIVWHVLAKPGRPVILFFHGNGDFLAAASAAFAIWFRMGPVSLRSRSAATPDRRDRRARRAS